METPIFSLLRSAIPWFKIFIYCTLFAFFVQENLAQVPFKPGIKLKAKLPPKNLSGQLIANRGPKVRVGTPLSFSGEQLASMEGSPALDLGIIANSRKATPFTAPRYILDLTVDPIFALGNWNTLIPDSGAPTARHENAFVQAGDKFYLVGGRGVKKVQEYDPLNKSWTDKAATPMEMHHFQAVAMDGLIYIAGAFKGSYPYEKPVPNVYIYNPLTDQWITGPALPQGRHRGSAGAVIYNKKIYLVSGIIDGHNSGHVPWMDEYDPATNTWKKLPDAPRPRDHFHAAVINNKLYLAGGRRSSYETGETFSLTVPEVDLYDFESGAWSTLPPGSNIPTQRAGTSSAVLGEELLIIGGESTSQSEAHKEAEALNVITHQWRRLDDLNVGRHGTQAIVNNNGIYTVAGSGRRGGSPELTSMEGFYMFEPTTPTGNPLSQSQLSAPEEVIFDAPEDNSPGTKLVTITNSGLNQSILISSIGITGSSGFSYSAPHPRPFVLPVGESVEITVIYNPAASADKTAEMVLTHSGLNGSTVIALTEANGSIAALPTNLDFFSQKTGTTSDPQEVVLTNNKTTNLEISSVNIIGNNGSQFSHSFTGPVILSAGASTTFSVYFTPSSIATKVAEISIIHTGENSPISVGLKGEGSDNVGEATRINAGGGQVNAFGTTFEADQYFSGGTTYTNNNITNIAGTTHDALYRSERYGSFSYNVPVPSGIYTVRLHFAEVWFGATGGGSGGVGKRVFNVTGEGQALLTNFDIYAEVGSMTALVKEFQVSVSDGTMNLGFVTVVDNAKVAAIEIRANSGTANLEPIAKAGPDQTVTAGANGLASVQQAGSGSSDPDGSIASYVWKEGNTQLATGATPTVSLAVGTHNITLTVTDNQGATDTDQVMVTVKSLETTTATRINSGGAQVAAFGATFVADQYFSGGTTYTNNNITNIASTTHDALYSSERFGTFSYNVPVPSGTYTVRLHFAEVWFGATGGGSGGVGKRVFNVTGEGQALLTNFDIYAEVGSMTALVKEFQVSVSDGTMNLGFVTVVDNAKVAAIEIRSNSGTANLEPIAKAGPEQTVTAGANGLASVQLAGSGSSDPDGTIASYVWKEGNTQLATGATPKVSLAVGTHNITLTVTDNQGATDTDQVMVTVKSLETTAIRINTGGPQVAAFGSTFMADQYFSGGTTYTNTKITNIAGTTYDELYKSERYGTFSYNVPVPSGTYTVRLHFAEIYFGATGGTTAGVGRRVFNVTGEGQPLLTDFDIHAEVGSMTALVKEFQVSVSDGTLNLSFSPKVNNAKISALEVLSSSGVNLRIGENQNISDHKIQSITPETMVPIENGGVVNVNPNPFEDIINLHFQKEEPQNYEIRVYDVAGRIYFQGTFSSKSTEKSIYPINLANKSLATGGMYLVFIESENGKFMKIFKMIKR